MNLTKLEKETIVNYNEAEGHAEIYTASSQTMRKLDKLCQRFPDAYVCINRNEKQATYRCPKRQIRFASPPSEAVREAARQRAASGGFSRKQQRGAEELTP